MGLARHPTVVLSPGGTQESPGGLFKNTSVQAVLKTIESERGPQSLLAVYSSQEMLRDST